MAAPYPPPKSAFAISKGGENGDNCYGPSKYAVMKPMGASKSFYFNNISDYEYFFNFFVIIIQF